MSWTTEFIESNSFRVKNTEEVKQVLETMGFSVYGSENGSLSFFSDENAYYDEDTEVVLSLKPIDKDGNITNFIGIISDSCMDSVELSELEEGSYMVQSITEYLQDQLADEKQYITIMNVGFEGRMSGNYNPFGDIVFITKSQMKSASLWSMEQQFKRECGLIESEVQ